MTSSTGTVVFNDAKLQAIDVVATERLGVGTLDPTSNLHVVGNVHVTGNVNKLNFTDGYTIKRGANVTVFGTTDVIQEITGPHARDVVPLRKYPEVAFAEGKFDTTDNEIVSTYWAGHSTVFQGGYSVKTSHHSTDDGGQYGWHVFDDNPETIWKNAEDYNSSTGNYDYGFTNVQSRLTDTNSTNHDGDHVIMGSPSKLKIVKVSVTCKSSIRRVVNYSVLGSNSTGTTGWTLLDSGSFAAQDANIATITSPTTHFKYHAFVVRSVTAGVNGQRFQINSIHYYGYDEDVGAGDDSVDVTFKSVYNSPDLTNAALYIDGDKGSTPTDFSGEGHALTDNSESFSGNAWSFTSLSTSNVTMSTGDFAMEGTHPHAVSMWFNAANVSSNATLFHVGTAAGEGDAKTAISLTESGHLGWIDGGDNQFLSANTWHNLVYATQGGGGVRTCYLDGRKLGDAQVQDTFGDYPPFAMSGYSQGGYTASASLDIGNGEAWEAFDDIEGNYHNAWQGDGTTYSTTTRLHTGGETTTVSGTPYDGDWIQMEFPHKMYLSYIGILPMVTYGVERMPGIAIFAGSNDATTWALIRSITKNDHTAGNYSNYILNSDTCYKYIRIIWNELTTAGSTDSYRNRAAAQEIKFYGHKENDTTRFPVSSTVLKYPHVAMTGPAQRGYVVSGSTHAFIPSSDSRDDPWRAFEGSNDVQNWKTHEMYTTAGVYSPATYSRPASSITDTGSTQHSGEYLVLETPRKITLSSWEVKAAYAGRRIVDYAILGSDTNSSSANKTGWTLLTNGTFAAQETVTATVSSPTTAFKYHAIVVKSVTNHSDSRRAQIDEMKLYGTEEDLDVVARVGEGLDGKVANFRVYDKYLHEEQALELWDAQKDQFGRAESSVVVHKGRLGVGTTEPEGRFAVLDEPNTFESRWPPKPLVGYNTHIEGYGEFVVHRSGNESTGQYRGNSWYIFDDNQNTHNYTYHGERDVNDPINGNYSYFKGTNGEYSGNKSIGGFSGDWTVLESPNPIKINDIIRMRVRSAGQSTTGFIIAAANEFDGGVWTKLTEQSNLVWQSGGVGESKTFHFENDTYYKYYAIIITQAPNQYGYPTLSNMEFSGIVQQGQSTLHDGQLTLTKNLTVPRIGPAFDADDTPRRDRLVVEYNTSTNPTENGTVKDTSGRGLDGLMVGVTYDSTEKAFVSTAQDGSQWIETKIPKNGSRLSDGFSGTIWVNHEYFDTTTKNSFVWTVGDRSGTGNNREFGLSYNAVSETLKSYFATFNGGSGNLNLFHTSQTSFGTWTHAGITYDGTTVKLYINGVFSGSSTLTDVNISDNNCVVRLNGDAVSANSTHQGTPMSLSNFKLYDTALTAEEVKTLYDMGRCDEGHHVVNFSKTRVGIGLGDGEAPRADLDVRGDIYGGCPVFFSANRSSGISGAQDVIYNQVHYNKGGGYSGTTGKFTAPLSGYYKFNWHDLTRNSANSTYIYPYINNNAVTLPNSTDADKYGVYDQSSDAVYRNMAGSWIVYLNTGDTFHIRLVGGNFNSNFNCFNGFYLSS